MPTRPCLLLHNQKDAKQTNKGELKGFPSNLIKDQTDQTFQKETFIRGIIRMWLSCTQLRGRTEPSRFEIQDGVLSLSPLLRPCLPKELIIYHSALIGLSELCKSCFPDRPLNQTLNTDMHSQEHTRAHTHIHTHTHTHTIAFTIAYWG